MSDQKNATRQTPGKPWSPPHLRTMVPVRRTRGGSFDPNDQDDSFYTVS